MISGISVAAKGMNPDIAVIAAEPTGMTLMTLRTHSTLQGIGIEILPSLWLIAAVQATG